VRFGGSAGVKDWPQYDRTWLRGDVIAGFTILGLLIPEGMAHAELAGLPPQAAFYAVPIGLLLYAIFGTLRQLMVAVSAVITTMSAATVSPLVAFWLAFISQFGVLTYEALQGLLIAVSILLAMLVWRASQPRLRVLGRTPAGIEFSDMAQHPENRRTCCSAACARQCATCSIAAG
jgi:MFS superfamily sulfate permease-like transporter